MKRCLYGLAGLVLAGIAGAVLFVYFGVYNVAATSGHNAVTKYVLHTAMQRSVAMRAGKGTARGFDDAPHLRLAAAHFSNFCARCHAAPGLRPQALGTAITPPAPDFRSLAGDWSQGQLFWIVRHGVKMTAMPAWPTQARPDEVWSMVAFLKKLPQMTDAEYRALAYGPSTVYPGDRVIDACVQCHGAAGNGRDLADLPLLSSQKPGYLGLALDNFRSGKRPSGIMQVVASQLGDADIRHIADYFSKAARLPPAAASDPARAAQGAQLAAQGSAARNIPACRTCHGPAATKENPIFPDIRGQRPQYIAQQLRLFQAGIRGGTQYARMMHAAAQTLSTEDIAALAAYYASLPVAGR